MINEIVTYAQKNGNSHTVHVVHKSSEMLNTCDNGRLALMQVTLPKPVLFPAIRSFNASYSRSAKYFL